MKPRAPQVDFSWAFGLSWIGWGLFLLSLFLPAVSAGDFEDARFHDGLMAAIAAPLHVQVLNTLLAATPLFLWFHWKSHFRGISILYSIAMLLGAGVAVSYFFSDPSSANTVHPLGSGYFLWVLSFAAVGTAMLYLSIGQGKENVDALP
ncbi:MAG: hypothetical protein K0U98_23180 [Deltaproteobacteria bacterium]|nr:hypothetical protein [Deltaproteobacteria bacterium]